MWEFKIHVWASIRQLTPGQALARACRLDAIPIADDKKWEDSKLRGKTMWWADGPLDALATADDA